jgi:hypothetical protein
MLQFGNVVLEVDRALFWSSGMLWNGRTTSDGRACPVGTAGTVGRSSFGPFAGISALIDEWTASGA